MHDSDLNFLSVADGQPAIERGSDLLSTDSVPDALPQDPISKMEPMPATPAFILARGKLRFQMLQSREVSRWSD